MQGIFAHHYRSLMRPLSVFGVLLPVVWITGIHVNDIAAIAAVLLILAARKKETLSAPFFEWKGVRPLLWTFVAVFVVFTVTQPILDVYLGRQGIDFAIFTQVVDSIARRGAALGSLTKEMEWGNFLLHHFVPFLYLPGALGFLGVPAYISASLAHGVAVGLAGLALGLTARRTLGYSSTFALVVVTLLFANSTFRHSVLFSIHDELYALPFIGFGFYFFLQEKHYRAVLALIGACLTKETMFLVVAGFGAMALIDFRVFPVQQAQATRRAAQRGYAGLLVCGPIAFLVYVLLHPLLGMTFEHGEKLATLAQIVQPKILGEKAWFLFLIFFPFLGLPLWRSKSWHLLLPATPLLGFIMVSSFDQMWRPLNYYGAVPTYCIAMASLIALRRSQKEHQPFPLSAHAVALLMAIAFSWSGTKPIWKILDAIRGPLLRPAQLAMIPDDAKVIAGTNGALMLLRTKMLWRLWQGDPRIPPDFDFVVTTPGEEGDVSSALKEQTTQCYSSPLWQIRCRRGSRLAFTSVQAADITNLK